MECPICLEDNNTKQKQLPICKHIFHESCLNEWLNINPICPLCRTNTIQKFICKKKYNYIFYETLAFSMDGTTLIFKNNVKNKKYEYDLKLIKAVRLNNDSIIDFYAYITELEQIKKIKYKFKNNKEANIVLNMIIDKMYS